MGPTATYRNDTGALVAGIIALAFSFSPYFNRVGASVDDIAIEGGKNAWNSYAVVAMLLIVVAFAGVVIFVFAHSVLPPDVPWRLIAAALAGVGTLLLIVRAFTYTDYCYEEIDVGPGWSAYVLFAAAIALTAFLALGALGRNQRGDESPPTV